MKATRILGNVNGLELQLADYGYEFRLTATEECGYVNTIFRGNEQDCINAYGKFVLSI